MVRHLGTSPPSADHFIASSDVAPRLRLRSANRHQLIVPRCRLNTYGRRAFSIAGPTFWNSLPHELTDPAYGSDILSSFLRQSGLVFTNVTSALEVSFYALYKSTFYFTLLYCTLVSPSCPSYWSNLYRASTCEATQSIIPVYRSSPKHAGTVLKWLKISFQVFHSPIVQSP